MKARIFSAVGLIVLSLALVACSQPAQRTPDATPPDQGITDGEPTPGDGAAGLRLAPGYYELEDGTAQALGTLEYRDLEGGLWAVIDDTQQEGGEGKIAAVINNPDEFTEKLEKYKGKQVLVTGTPFDGASIRMAGPEIVVDEIEELSDTPGIAE